MRFRLSTCLLCVVIVAAGSAWYIDRNALDSELRLQEVRHRHDLEEIVNATSCYEHAATLLDSVPNPIEPNDNFDRLLIYALLDLCEHENSIEKFDNVSQNESAVDLAAEILYRLECEMETDFREMATRLIIGGVPESFHPAIHNSNLEPYQNLSRFLEIAFEK